MKSRLRAVAAAVFTAIFCCLGLVSTGFAQEKNGGVSDAWEAKYKDEPFVRLLAETVVTINRDFTTSTSLHVIDRIQNDKGKKNGEITISYERAREEVEGIEAYTILPDGTRLPYSKVQDVTDNSDCGVYTDQRSKIVTMPSVVVGSIVDWKATVVSKKPVIDNHFYDQTYVDNIFPVKTARYVIKAPKDLPLKFSMLNADLKPKIETAGETSTYIWEAGNVDKVEGEEYMPSPDEVYKVLNVSTLNDWKALASWEWAMNARNMKASPAMKEKVREIVDGKTTNEARVQAIFEWLQDNVRYVSMNIESHSFEPHPADEVFENKYGDCKDQTLLAMVMLAEIGVKARPVLVPGLYEFDERLALPMPTHFNHAILEFDLDGASHFYDVLQKGYNFSQIPISLSGRKVLVVDDKGGTFKFVPRADATEYTFTEDAKVYIGTDGSAVIEDNAVLPRSYSVGMREQLRNMSDEHKEKFFAAMDTKISNGGKVLEKLWLNLDTPYTLLNTLYRYEDHNMVQQMGDMLAFGLSQSGRSSAFSMIRRVHPVVYQTPAVFLKRVTYVIPDGYEIVSVPKKVEFDTVLTGFSREYVVKGGRVVGEDRMISKVGRLPAAEYKLLVDFFDGLPKATKDKIVIRKIAGS